MTDDGWQVDPRPAPPELAEDFEPERFEGSEPLHAHSHIDSWNTFGQLLGPDGVKALMRAVQ